MPNEENQMIPEQGSEVLGMEKKVEAPKDKPKDKDAENELLQQMMFSPSSTNADSTITLDKTSDESESEAREREEFENKKPQDLLKILEEKGDGKLAQKYQKELLDKALKDPSSVEVNTPEGWMTVRDAIDAGFNLATGQFSEEPIEKPNWDEEISKLDPREQATIRRLAQRDTPQAGPRPEGMPGETADGIPMSGEASLEEGGINPRPDVAAPEAPASEAGMEAGSVPEVPLGM